MKNVRIKTKDYEKGNMEDGDTGDCIDSDSSTDSNGNNVMHGAGTSILNNYIEESYIV